MPNPKVDPASRAIIAELLATDADLRDVARQFVMTALTDLVNLQQRGDPAIRAALAKSLAGPIVSAITEPVDEDAFGSLRAEFVGMIAEMRDEIVVPTADIVPVIDIDPGLEAIVKKSR